MTVMFKIEEKLRYTMKEAEQIRRKELGISQKTLGRLMGLNEHTWAGWVATKEYLPSTQVPRFIQLVENLRHIAKGEKLLPVANGSGTPMNRYLNESLEALEVLEMQLHALQGNEPLKRSMLSLAKGIKDTLNELI